ncbi:MAG: Txe/YoeB family addiction module toxin [Rhodothermaeota bacterium MED-G64]|nr:MAG: Txe/YoeB family addiction module toxin [Rhodothermaeota bacterium MED-G64]HBD42165.1 Txe/YoeB family addiction module toxin [Bacteroidota bacterium]
MKTFRLVYTKQAKKDAKKASSAGLKPKIEQLLDILAEDPWTAYPPYESLVGNLKGAQSRRINIQHRLVYQVYENEKVVKVIRMWSHYE